MTDEAVRRARQRRNLLFSFRYRPGILPEGARNTDG